MTCPSARSAAMRDGSRAEHEAAEASPFLTDLLEGRVGPSRYAGYLARLRVVYAALEEVGRAHRDDPWVAAVTYAERVRGASGPAYAKPSKDAYRARLDALDAGPPGRVVTTRPGATVHP